MSNFYHIGVIQGRLLPKYKGRYQAHPVGYWQDEFGIAARLGLDVIEFILDYENSDKNPLMCDKGVQRISQLVENTSVEVKSICADYFIEAPLHSPDASVRQKSQEVLKTIISNATRLGVSNIVIPCVDKSSLRDKDMEIFVSSISSVLELIERTGVNLALETDLPPNDFAGLLNRFGSSHITVNYDIGNSASLGYNPQEELTAYGERISDIHVKDRLLGGGPVMLGEGDADFDKLLSALKKRNYNGLFIMQTYRDNEGLEVFKQQLMTFTRILDAYGYVHRIKGNNNARRKNG